MKTLIAAFVCVNKSEILTLEVLRLSYIDQVDCRFCVHGCKSVTFLQASLFDCRFCVLGLPGSLRISVLDTVGYNTH